MEKVNAKKMLQIIAAVLGALVLYKIIGFGIDHLSLNGAIAQFAKELVFLTEGVIVAGIFHKLDVLKFTFKGFGKGLAAGAYYLIITTIMFLMTFTTLAAGREIAVSGMDIVLFMLTMLMVGMVEELLYRGVLQNGFHKFFGESSVKNVRLAVLCTGVIFGLSHLLNITVTGFSPASITGVLVQGIVTIPMGMLFCAIYYRSNKNLWVCILLHAFYDMATMMVGGYLFGVDYSSQISTYGVSQLYTAVGILLIVLFLLRKKKIEPMLNNGGNGPVEDKNINNTMNGTPAAAAA